MQAPEANPHGDARDGLADAAVEPLALRFGPFELDLLTSELRRDGQLVKLQQQPCRVLALLARRTGQLVTREEIHQRVWGADTFVDFEQGLNFCIRQVRGALGDEAARPRFIETLPRRGYRFVADVETVWPDPPAVEPSGAHPAPTLAPEMAPAPPAGETTRWRPGRRLAAAAALLAAGLAAVAWLLARREPAPVAQPRPGRVLLVVLPFANLEGDTAQDYFSDGLTEEMITQLARLHPPRLGVIARTSSMRYKQRAVDIPQVGRELGVDYVLEGSVRRGPERLRVTAQLIAVADGTHLWAESYDEPLSDLLAVQDRVARRIAGSLLPQLLAADGGPQLKRSAHPEAYDAYLRGRHQWGRNTRAALQQSLVLLRRSLALDPGFAAAHAALAQTYLSLGDGAHLRPQEAYPAARAAAEEALRLDPGLAEAHLALGVVRTFYDWDLRGGPAALRQALRLSPGMAEVHRALCEYYAVVGRHDEAVAAAKRAVELDPVSAVVLQDLGWYLLFARRPEEALTAFRHTLETEPEDREAQGGLMTALALLGRYDQASELAAAAARRIRAAPEARLVELARRGDREGFQALVRRNAAELTRRGLTPADLLGVHALAQDRERALEALEFGRDVRARYLLVLAASDPRLDFVRAEPRFAAVLATLGLPVPSTPTPADWKERRP